MNYEVIQELKNSCKANTMRDIFFFEEEIGDPDSWVRAREPRAESIQREDLPGGGIRYRVSNSGLITVYNLTAAE